MIVCLSNSSLMYTPKITGREKKSSHKILHISVYGNIIPNSQKEETTQTSISAWMNKQNAVYNGILFIQKKEWSIDICYNIDES